MRPAVSRFADLMDKKLDELDPDHAHAYRDQTKEELCISIGDNISRATDILDEDDDDAVIDGNVMIATQLMMMSDKLALAPDKKDSSVA